MKFNTNMLMAPEGEASGGGGGAEQPQPGPAHGASPSPTPTPADEAPVTRAEFAALLSKLDQIARPPAPAAAPATSPAPSSAKDEPPAWAKELLAREARREADARKQQLLEVALAEVPAEHRGTARAVVEGLLVTHGVSLDTADVGQVGRQLAGALKSEHAALFAVPGSKYAAIPRTSTGGYDFSGVRDLTEVPDHMIKYIPKDEYARLRHGPSGGGVIEGQHVGIIPRSRFH